MRHNDLVRNLNCCFKMNPNSNPNNCIQIKIRIQIFRFKCKSVFELAFGLFNPIQNQIFLFKSKCDNSVTGSNSKSANLDKSLIIWIELLDGSDRIQSRIASKRETLAVQMHFNSKNCCGANACEMGKVLVLWEVSNTDIWTKWKLILANCATKLC